MPLASMPQPRSSVVMQSGKHGEQYNEPQLRIYSCVARALA